MVLETRLGPLGTAGHLILKEFCEVGGDDEDDSKDT